MINNIEKQIQLSFNKMRGIRHELGFLAGHKYKTLSSSFCLLMSLLRRYNSKDNSLEIKRIYESFVKLLEDEISLISNNMEKALNNDDLSNFKCYHSWVVSYERLIGMKQQMMDEIKFIESVKSREKALRQNQKQI